MDLLDPNMLLRAYAIGVFPMADSRDATDVFWVEPKMRAILPLDGFRVSHSLAKTIRSDRFRVTRDAAFDRVVSACAEARPDRPDTWINPAIQSAYGALHRRNHAHSIECWQGEELVGGLYGVRLGRAFFGESMFSRVSNASKVALAHLVARMKAGGFALLDCQFMTDHLASLGAIEISKDDYASLLDAALSSLGLGGTGSTDSATGADLSALEGLFPDDAGPDGALSGYVISHALGQTS
ncbi:leucyl/phenylalanyl-tRNA--protein transferase [Parasphingopyxis algicola]|uniref:leucyl/phenylalanyl-tRNA--protein transferase n=1 Tax=Parasphingopyxis algicola TaxID=2026624 RepID=UPI0015A31D2A|nr:leucyl/phenylalanyl-tRNA--protein transferase [Parasphingopyxis algicola]QLC24711.1 leucyl/phenylalanyl-tRNA--protein transferase [Parasphingopyxis algicola]